MTRRDLPVAPSSRPPESAYACALKLLARRELSSGQLRDRLRALGFLEPDIQEALDRLARERALDDVRAAVLRARRAVTVQHRGRERILRELEAAGIPADAAARAVLEVFAEVSETSVAERALAGRLRGLVRDRAHFRRLHAYLVRQGFGSEIATRLLEARLGPGIEIDRE